MSAHSENRALARLVLALGDFRGDVVFIGGWAHRPVFLTEPEYPVGPQAVEIRIANGTSYLAQKLLALEKRDPDDRGKDVLYIRDTLITLGASLPELQKIWSEAIAPVIQANVPGRLRGAVDSLFSEVSNPVRRGSQIARDAGRPVSPEEIAGVCRKGLSEVFGIART